MRKGREPFKSMWSVDGIRIKELSHIHPDTSMMIVSRDKKFLQLKNAKLNYTLQELKEEDQQVVRGKLDSVQEQWFR